MTLKDVIESYPRFSMIDNVEWPFGMSTDDFLSDYRDEATQIVASVQEDVTIVVKTENDEYVLY